MRKLAVLLVLVAACSTKSASTAQTSKIEVAASTTAWGSLAAALGGDRVHVTNIVSNPDADPHDYEPTAADARTLSTAQYVIFNGVGYDEWARRVVDSNGSTTQTVLDIGNVVGAKSGDNPHRWYFPDDVRKVVARIVEDYKRIDPRDATQYEQRGTAFLAGEFKKYDNVLNTIRQRYPGVPVGASESLFVGIADATGLDLTTPRSFVTAISEGVEPSLQDKTAVDQQIASKTIKVYVFNPQNSTPDVANLVAEAHRQGIPVVEFTETLVPEGATFVEWQVGQLQALADALATATGR
ncbi:MAG: zinc/manganese transport system substrate-binding protein [Acidimicrobiaceae bacterium]